MKAKTNKTLVVTTKVEYTESEIIELIKLDASNKIGCPATEPNDNTQVNFEFIECSCGGINGATVTVIERIPANRK